MSVRHIGRSWTGHALEDTCPCVKTACGLVPSDRVTRVCPQHGFENAKTIRQSHAEDDCPNLHQVAAAVERDDHGTVVSARLDFTCHGSVNAECHVYPDGMPTWDGDDNDEATPFVPHQKCWMSDWFTHGALDYVGPDFTEGRDGIVPGESFTGPIKTNFCQEYIEWSWAKDEATAADRKVA